MPNFAETQTIFPIPEAKSTKNDQPAYVAGYRKRIRTRFKDGGADAMPDYELLELILFRSIRRGDPKPLAYELIKQFGDFNRVLAAPLDQLTKVKCIGPATALEIKIVEAAAHRMAQSQVLKQHVISSWDALIKYCHTVMAHREAEQFRILFLDTKNTLIADEEQAKGTVDHVPVYPREVVKRALELNAASILLVHNHPSGDPTPSQADITMTDQIVQAAQALGIMVHDHLIIGKSRELSFRAAGLL